MKKLIAALALAVLAGAAYAACRYYTVTLPDGRLLFCSECCFNGICNVTCN